MPAVEPRAIPLPTTSFIGRRVELSAIDATVGRSARLVTLRGAPGVGKTRLAIEWGRAHAQRAGIASCFVELASLRGDSDVASALLDALGEPPSEGDTDADARRTRAGAALARRGKILVILDNAEHLLAPLRVAIEAWLASAPRCTFVVTSRESLGVSGEVLFDVAPLAVGDVHTATTSPAAVMQLDAVRLFVERARAAHPRFAPNGDEVVAVAEVVRRLEGLPLAIELAAVRMAVTTTRELAELLDRSLDLLSARGKARGLRAVIDQSWALLDEPERRLLARASLFRGGFSLDHAEAIVAEERDPPTEDASVARERRVSRRLAAIDAVQGLVEKSLIHAFEPTGVAAGRRFRLLEPVREHARERLDASTDARDAIHAHADAVLTHAEANIARATRGASSAVRALALEEENLHAVITDATRHNDRRPDHVARALVCLGSLCAARGDGARYLDLVHACADTVSDASARYRADAYAWQGRTAIAAGRNYEAVEAYERAERLYRADGDVTSLVFVLARLAIAADYANRADVAAARLREAEGLASRAQASGRIALLEAKGLSSMLASDLSSSRAHFERALALALADDDRVAQGRLLGYLGWSAFKLGQLASARANLEQALVVLADVGPQRLHAAYTGELGLVLLELGFHEEARARLLASIDEHRRIGDLWHEAQHSGYLGSVELEAGNLEEARRWLRAACALHERTGDGIAAATFYLGLGACADASAEPDEARSLFDLAERLANEAGGAALVLESLEILRQRSSLDANERPSNGDARAKLRALRDEATRRLEARPEPGVRHALRVAIAGFDRLERSWDAGAAAGVRVAEDGAWIEIDGARVEIARGAERRILRELAERRARAPGEGVSIDALFAAGWGSERASADSRANRVRVTVSALRKATRKSLIETRPNGYRLDIATLVVIA
ncbi:MAG: tetratricopeptide repeat protein [Myxococcales bacterium]|nr:tetratricopeptide repeat protein [Myxococcales bacterium]